MGSRGPRTSARPAAGSSAGSTRRPTTSWPPSTFCGRRRSWTRSAWAVMGWSFGGIVTMFAVSRSNAFAVAVDQAGGALTWNGKPDERTALTAAAQKCTTPTLLQVAENDRTTDSITTVAKILEKRGVPHRMVIYPPFTAATTSSFGTGAPGHMVFAERGMSVWSADALEFLGRYLTGTTR